MQHGDEAGAVLKVPILILVKGREVGIEEGVFLAFVFPDGVFELSISDSFDRFCHGVSPFVIGLYG